jgi:hypothetical protein
MYPCTMLNKLVADYFTNDQYHITDPDNPERIEIKKECSVLFEGDGPYKVHSRRTLALASIIGLTVWYRTCSCADYRP